MSALVAYLHLCRPLALINSYSQHVGPKLMWDKFSEMLDKPFALMWHHTHSSNAILQPTRRECDGSRGGCQSHRNKRQDKAVLLPHALLDHITYRGNLRSPSFLSTDGLIHSLQWRLYKGKELVLPNVENYTTQMNFQTMDGEAFCVNILSAEGKLRYYSVPRHQCVWAHSGNAAECRGELASEAGGPLHPSTLRWPMLRWRVTWCQHAC